MRHRASWDEYFMRIAEEVASRATCDRKHVGAVIVRDKSILATGYNGSIRGLPHCDEEGHLMEDGHCVRTIHAEGERASEKRTLHHPERGRVRPPWSRGKGTAEAAGGLPPRGDR